MPSSFFTNEGGNTLKNKINHILKNDKNIEYLDFVIGYFRMSGFEKIAENLSSIENMRILIGINTDKHTYNASEYIKKFAQEQVDIYNEEPLDAQEYSYFYAMKSLILNKKISIRICPNKNVHSKMYILRSDALVNHSNTDKSYRGSVIIGSSNLTHNGLEGNTEINAELSHERDIIEAVSVFEKLWKDSVELSEDDFDTFIFPKLKEPPLDENALSPYQFYMKLLIEHFGNRVHFIEDENLFVPQSYKKLSYQVEAVNDALAKLQAHNGLFLSDVVGLGKTLVVAMLIKKQEATLKKRVLIVLPPAVRIQWQDTLKEFEIETCDIVSLASLHRVQAHKYEMVVVDESHKFKNSQSQRYKQLFEICLNKKVILLSATPQNNRPNDLYNQIALFQNVKHSTLPNCPNLQGFFSKKDKEYKNIINNEPIDKKALETLSSDIRDKVLRTLMIRRTRHDIEHHDMYKEDIKAQGLCIPKVTKPKEHEYKLERNLGIVFDDTAIKITQKLNYSRFNLLFYLTKEAQDKYYPKESQNIFSENPLDGLMKTLLIKRFESSFSAFKISINRHKKRYAKFIENYENNIIYLGEKATDILDYEENNEKDFEDFIEDLKNKNKVKVLERQDFNPIFEKNLKSDYKIFQELVEVWKDIYEDPKLEKFKKVLKDEKEKKIVIFTESVDTLLYLKEKLQDHKKILFISSQNREEKNLIIRENFDANYEQTQQKNNYDIIITTDTLAEGINLHRSNTIYNYDIPWNATKLIQRIGRVNRIGSKEAFIHIHNFKPASKIEELIKLSQKAFVKLQSSHTMMGEDNQIYSKEEEVSSVSLFEKYEKISQEKDEELEYLEVLRKYKKTFPKGFETLSRLSMPLSMIRGEAKASLPKKQTLSETTALASSRKAYIALEINQNKKYIFIEENSIQNLSFVQIAKVFSALSDEKALLTEKKHDYETQVINYFEKSFRKDKADKAEKRIDVKSEQTATSYLKEWLKKDFLTQEAFRDYKKAIQKGTLSFLSIKELNTLYKQKDEVIKEKLSIIINQKRETQEKLFEEDLDIKVLLSAIFTKEEK